MKFKLKKIKITEAKEKLKKSAEIILNRAFLAFLAVLFFNLFLGALIFYKYAVWPEQKSPESYSLLKLNEKDYQDALKALQERKKKFDGAGSLQYPNPVRVLPKN